MTCRCDPFTGDECQSCKNKVLIDKAEYERLQRLEEAAIEWANVGSVGLPRLAQGAQQRLYALARKAAEKARTE